MTAFELPSDISEASFPPPRDFVIVSIPKMGKGTILGDFTKHYNGIVFGLEKGGYEYISARKIEIYPTQDTTLAEAYNNYISYKKELLKNKGKYEYLIVDGLSDLDILSELGGTRLYMNSIVGKKFNRDKSGQELKFEDPEYKLVTTLPDGAGYKWTREWFMKQKEQFEQISPYRIWAGHTADKYIKDNGKEEVVGTEIALTGKLKSIFSSKVTALAKLTADGNKRYLNFEVQNDSIIAGSRNPKLEGKILISEKTGDKITTFWENIYGQKSK